MSGWLAQTVRSFVDVRKLFKSELGKHRRLKILVIFAIVLAATSNTLLIWLVGQPVDLIFHRDYGPLVSLLLLLSGVVLVNQFSQLVMRVFSDILGLRFVGEIRNRLVNHLMGLSYPVVQKYSQGDLLSRLSYDSDELQRLLIEYPFLLLLHLSTIIFYLVMLFLLDWRLATGALLLSPLFVLHQRIFSQRKRKAAEGFMHENGRLLGYEHSVIQFIKAISTLDAKSWLAKGHLERFQSAYNWAAKERWLDGLFFTSLMALLYLGAIFMVFAGMWFVEDGSLSPGSLVSFLIYLGYLSVPFRGLSEMPFHAQTGLAAASRISELLLLKQVALTESEGFQCDSHSVRLSVKDLSFSYEGENLLLDNISFSVEPGEAVAIVGASGVGKSTLINLILRMLEPKSGQILMNDKDINKCSIESVRGLMSVVWQEDLLLPISMRQNLMLAKPSASEEQLIQACKDSGAWQFIKEMDEGLDTIIGEQGIMLSGGQQQRLSIARAFLRDTPILIMDEPTSALDSQSEQHLMQSMQRLAKDRTTLIIAHRFSTIREADRVIFLNGDGSISIGTHDELMRTHEAYSATVYWQTHQ